jgi:hypothetical protein|tara:strand:+ start:1820 stop:2287 length:468 start_codon:yes stop_codon:yes gene_type:complete
MKKLDWALDSIEPYLPLIQTLFQYNADHKHASNYTQHPLFECTKFARMGFDGMELVYYSAGIERPEYNGSIRIMSRHTRSRQFDFGGYKSDLIRGVETLDLSVEYALSIGYEDIWVSREEGPQLLEYFAKSSAYDWSVSYETLHYGGKQYVLRKN